MRAPSSLIIAALMAATAAAGAQSQEGFRFRSGVDLVNVTATVTDDDGRFVSGLRREDFTVYEDGKLQDVSHFSNDRVPVSLGLLLDTSGSMSADKMSAARSAIDRLIYDLLGKDDELFLVEFATTARLTQGLDDRPAGDQPRGTRGIAAGGTAIYDAVATAIPTAQAGTHRKKALLVISDGNDTNSTTSVGALRQQIRESDVLVYALGIDGTRRRSLDRSAAGPDSVPRAHSVSRRPPDHARPAPDRRRQRSITVPERPGDRVNADALRQITDDTGGRTEIVRGSEGLGSATARIADELSKQVLPGVCEPGGTGRPMALHSRRRPRSASHCPRAPGVHRVLI